MPRLMFTSHCHAQPGRLAVAAQGAHNCNAMTHSVLEGVPARNGSRSCPPGRRRPCSPPHWQAHPGKIVRDLHPNLVKLDLRCFPVSSTRIDRALHGCHTAVNPGQRMYGIARFQETQGMPVTTGHHEQLVEHPLCLTTDSDTWHPTGTPFPVCPAARDSGLRPLHATPSSLVHTVLVASASVPPAVHWWRLRSVRGYRPHN